MKEKGICKCCQKPRVIFYKNLCQSCYKAQTNKKDFTPIVDYKEIKNLKHRKIVKMWCKNKVPRADIAEYFDMTKRNIDTIIKRYCKQK